MDKNKKINNKINKYKNNSPLKSKSSELSSDPYKYSPDEVPLIWPESFMDSLFSDISDLYDEKENSRRNLKDKARYHHEVGHFCKVCKESLEDETYVWDEDLRDYLLIGSDGTPQKDKRLDVRYVEDDVKEFIALKKRFGASMKPRD